MAAVLTIDVAHPPRHPDRVEEELEGALSALRLSPEPRILRVIHGHGSSGRGGSTRDTVRNWAFRRRSAIRETLYGEDCTPFSPVVQSFRSSTGLDTSGELLDGNPGITILWLK